MKKLIIKTITLTFFTATLLNPSFAMDNDDLKKGLGYGIAACGVIYTTLRIGGYLFADKPPIPSSTNEELTSVKQELAGLKEKVDSLSSKENPVRESSTQATSPSLSQRDFASEQAEGTTTSPAQLMALVCKLQSEIEQLKGTSLKQQETIQAQGSEVQILKAFCERLQKQSMPTTGVIQEAPSTVTPFETPAGGQRHSAREEDPGIPGSESRNINYLEGIPENQLEKVVLEILQKGGKRAELTQKAIRKHLATYPGVTIRFHKEIEGQSLLLKDDKSKFLEAITYGKKSTTVKK
ncbi:MAG: hypothetical protein K2Y18_07755 [Alphaproteobacteria bacterium]|jgi:hypothetical protein|nr:hypothetical protein [Alphaproteobacteria bacterium]